MRFFILFVALFLINTEKGEATFITAGHLLENCRSYTPGGDYNSEEERLCNGYVMGVHDTAKSYERLFETSPLYCEPPRVSSDQMVLVVKKYLFEHPEFLQGPAAPKVIDAFSRAFPCH